jgi:hypothetical protein
LGIYPVCFQGYILVVPIGISIYGSDLATGSLTARCNRFTGFAAMARVHGAPLELGSDSSMPSSLSVPSPSTQLWPGRIIVSVARKRLELDTSGL